MSFDLDIQIRNLYEDIETHQDPIALDEIRTTRVPVVDVKPSAGRLVWRRGWVVALATAAAVFLAGLVVVLALQESSDPPVINQPDPLPTTLPEGSPTTVPETAQTTLPPTVTVGPLSWQLADFGADAEVFLDAVSAAPSGALFDGGDRFVFVHGLGDAVSTSFDGVTWATRKLPELAGDLQGIVGVWEDTLVTVHSTGEIRGEEFVEDAWTVSVLPPDGTVNQRVFDANVDSMAIGPAGIVAKTSSNIHDDDIVRDVLGVEFAGNLLQTDLRDGVLYAETTGGETAEIVLADHGYDPDNLGQAGGWYSSDGQEWVPILDFPPVDGLVGTRDGFVGIGDTDVWHSSDGQRWQNLGSINLMPWFSPSGLASRWRDGALITDGSEFLYVSASGIESLPAPPDAISTSDSAPWPLVAAGDVGITQVSVGSGEFLFSSDGVSWVTTNLPNDMADSFGWFTSQAAATDTAVLLLLWDDHQTGGPQEPVWWIGTLP